VRNLALCGLALMLAANTAASQSSVAANASRYPRMGLELFYGGCCEPLRVDQNHERTRSEKQRVGGFVVRASPNPWFAFRLEGMRLDRRSPRHDPNLQFLDDYGPGPDLIPRDAVTRDRGRALTFGGELNLHRGRAFASLSAGFGGIAVSSHTTAYTSAGEHVYRGGPPAETNEIWSLGARVGYRMFFTGIHYLVPPRPIAGLANSVGTLMVGTRW
jgi:hypothetical protein